MKDYSSPELIKLGDAVQLTLGTRPGDYYDQNGAEYWPEPPGCCGGCGGDPDPEVPAV